MAAPGRPRAGMPAPEPAVLLELGDFRPADTVPKVRDPVTGEVFEPRASVTDEQEEEAVAHVLRMVGQQRFAHRPPEAVTARVRVIWTRYPPSVLSCSVHFEQAAGKRLPVLDRMIETDEADLPRSLTDQDRYRRLLAELTDAETPRTGL